MNFPSIRSDFMPIVLKNMRLAGNEIETEKGGDTVQKRLQVQINRGEIS